MNAPDTTVVPRAATPVHPTHKFKLLLQREYWEHKGGFLWAPLIAGGISLLLTGMRSDEHTSELQSLLRISYAVFCLKKQHTNHSRHRISPMQPTPHRH